MNNLQTIGHATRVAFGTLAALSLLVAATACASSPPITSAQFAPGWQAHSRALINMGPGIQPDRTKWFVPTLLPAGRYVVVVRNGDQAEVVDQSQFEVKPGRSADLYLFVRTQPGDIQAVPLADVPAMSRRLGVSALP